MHTYPFSFLSLSQMHKALKSAISLQFPSTFSHPLPPPTRIITTRKPLNPGTIRLAQSESGPHRTDEMDREKQPNRPEPDPADTMSSFGEGYATRSDEEGFGGVYGGNQYLSKKTDHQAHEFGHDQGSEVKEKEKARNQEKVAP